MRVLWTAMAVSSLICAGSTAVSAQEKPDYPCGLEEACYVGERFYRALPPVGWDGRTPLPVLIHFHGWKRVSSHPLKNPKVLEAINGNGALLVAPEGMNNTWDFTDHLNRDVPFVRAVIADVAKRFPIDAARIYATGFSFGAAMSWRLACDAGDLIAGILPAAGTLLNQAEQTCPTGPVHVMVAHGLKDTVMRLPTAPDGNPNAGVELWRRTNQCGAAPDHETILNGHVCRVWSSCQSGKEILLCLHDGGHVVPHGWIEQALYRALERYRLGDGANASVEETRSRNNAVESSVE
ncbi:MAG: polyhydroxybutyrate depolymerase [Pseudomonadota bacterium]